MRYYAIKCAQYAIISFTTGFVGYRQHLFAGILQNYQEKNTRVCLCSIVNRLNRI